MISKERLDEVALRGDLRRVGEAAGYFFSLATDPALFTEFGPSESDLRDARHELNEAVRIATNFFRR
jgi:hypothetical protein